MCLNRSFSSRENCFNLYFSHSVTKSVPDFEFVQDSLAESKMAYFCHRQKIVNKFVQKLY
jgi:hypothetical protein